MSHLPRRAALLVSLLLLAGLTCYHLEAQAQDKKTQTKGAQGKKGDPKGKKNDPKDKKGTKEEKKEEKKIEYRPDVAQIDLKADKSGDWVEAIDYGPDGKTLGAAYRNLRVLRVWEPQAKKDLLTVKGLPSGPKGLVLRQGKLYSGVYQFDKKKKALVVWIGIWDAATGKEAGKLVGHAEPIECLAGTKDGKYLASGSEDGTAKLWDVAAGKDVQTFKGHTKAVHGVALTADGKTLATASADSTVKLWDAQSGKELASFKVPEKVIDKVDPKTKKKTQIKEGGRDFTCVAFSPDGKSLAAGNLDGQIKIYDVAGKKELRELKAHEGVWAVAFNPDGKLLASGGWDKTIRLWDTASWKDVRTIKAHLATVTALDFHPTAPQLASGGTDGLIRIWDVSPGKK